ncbi:MAG: 50S ribosomal protein L18 [Verrucomicrobia bacterium]|nr:50S ribosomal protein L18 [Verrucomicrobiota bacterium]
MHRESKNNINRQAKRKVRVRKKLLRLERPRLSVFRSSKHIYAQVIDDHKNVTIVGVGSYHKDFQKMKGNMEIAKKIGETLGKLALEKNIKEVVFDRGKYKFHGRVAALAEGARQAGLSF